MALFKSDIESLEKSAPNFLYIFIDEKTKGLSKDIMNKRKTQLAELVKIYQYQSDYSLTDLVNIIRMGLAKRYNKTPNQLLQLIYDNAVLPEGIGNTIPTPGVDPGKSPAHQQAAEKIKALTTTVTNPATGAKSNANLWGDIASLLEWLIAVLNRIFGNYTKPSTYNPKWEDWAYGNAPTFNQTKDAETGSYILPVLSVAGILVFLANTKQKKGDKQRKLND